MIVNAVKKALRAVLLRLEQLGDAAFGARLNPVVHLGALGWWLFWIVCASGIYVYVFFDTGVTQAYASLESLSREQWYLGGVMRSVHRYASDAMVVVVLLHMLREFAMDRMRGNRWFPWVTGVPLLWFLYACGITGYWLVWDQLAQYVAIATTEWLDAIGIFAQPIARNFLDSTRLSGRFFTLMVYIHIAVPLAMLLFMWVHIQRHAHARVNPPRALGLIVLGTLVALALVVPATSQPPADLDRVPQQVGLDWFYLAAYPLLDVVSGGTLWLALVGASLLLTALPWLPPLRKQLPAEVHLDNCNGCERCFADCPFGAITMVPRSDGAPYEQEARVVAELCVSCGICAGACPTATPFRRATALVPGIELPGDPIAALRDRVVAATEPLRGDARTLVVTCTHAVDPDALREPGVGVVTVPCVGMLPPPFIDFALSRKHADGVFIAGCAIEDCYERLGQRWTEARIANQRDPNLRDRVSRDRVAVSWNLPAQRKQAHWSLQQFRAHLRSLASLGRPATGTSAWQAPSRSLPAPVRFAAQLLTLASLAALIGWFSTRPTYAQLGHDAALLKLSFSHAGQPLKPCRRYSPEELAKLPFDQRRATTCERGRWPVYLELDLDGRSVHRGIHQPAGLWNDGPSTVYARFPVPAGRHRLDARLRDSGRATGFDYSGAATVTLEPGQNFVIDFQGTEGGFRFGQPRPTPPASRSTAR
jgi:ferredoxin/coenzyme F420-reducing hydrogenase delta subunit